MQFHSFNVLSNPPPVASVESMYAFLNILGVSEPFFRRTGAAERKIKVPAYAGVRILTLPAQIVLCF